MRSLRFASLLVLATASLALAGPLSQERFTRVRVGDRSVDAIELLPPDVEGSGLAAWVDGVDVKTGLLEQLGLPASAAPEPSVLLPATLRGRLVLTWRGSDILRPVYDLNRVSSVVYSEKGVDLELSVLVTPGEPGSYRGALAWRAKRGGKVLASGSTVFTAPEGEEVKVALGSSREGPSLARFTLSAR